MARIVPLEDYLTQLREAGKDDPRAAELAERYGRADVVRTEVAEDGTHYDHIRVGTFPGLGSSATPPAFATEVGAAPVPAPSAQAGGSPAGPARTIVVPRIPPDKLRLYYTKAPGGGTHPLLGHAEPGRD